MDPNVDFAKVEEFVGKVLGDMSGFGATLMAAIGDRLGLWRALADGKAITPAELAKRAGIHERYAREWLGGMTTAGYVVYDKASSSFSLPAHHTPVFAVEGSPVFFGGAYQMMFGTVKIFDEILEAFRTGAGVAQARYPDETFEGMCRFTTSWFDNLLLQVWLPTVPHVVAKLESGTELCDVGCGRGRALVKLAAAYPRSKFVGIDIHPKNIERARALAAEAGVGDRIRFELADGGKGLGGPYDVITTFDVVHDAADPLGLLKAIRKALRPDGSYLCLDINCSHELADNVGPVGTFMHTASIMYCMEVSIGAKGVGLGTLGLHEPKLRELAGEAGFGTVTRLEIENPFNNLYELRP